MKAGWAAAIALAARVALAAPPALPGNVVLRASGGQAVDLGAVVRAQRLTVVVFSSATCPCFAAHGPRLDALARALAPRGVRFLVVDSERHARGEATPPVVPGSALPILRDEGAALARRLDARYATEAFVFDAAGALRYHGGIDGDRKELTAAPRAYLRDALERLLADGAPPLTSSKALGCALRLR